MGSIDNGGFRAFFAISDASSKVLPESSWGEWDNSQVRGEHLREVFTIRPKKPQSLRSLIKKSTLKQRSEYGPQVVISVGGTRMPVVDLSDFLKDYSTPDLEMLKTTATQYTCLLLQPSGPIFASDKRIGNADIINAAAKGRKFLELAKTRGAHLAVTPEYFIPWSTLKVNDFKRHCTRRKCALGSWL